LNTLYNIIYRHLRGKTRLKRINAVVIGAVENSNNTKFKVTYINNENDEVCVVLINKSQDTLLEGDHVWVHYWNSITDGYIALKVGLSSFGAEGGETITPPINVQTKVVNSYQFTKTANTESNNYSYSVNEQIGQSERISFLYGTFVFDRYVYSPEAWEQGITFAAFYHMVWYYTITLFNNVVVSLTNDPAEVVPKGRDRLFNIYNATHYDNITLPFIIINNNQAHIEEYNYSIQLNPASLKYQIIETDSNSNTRVCHTYPGGYSNDSVAFILESSIAGFDRSTMWNTDFGNESHGINGINITMRPVVCNDGQWQRYCPTDPSGRYGSMAFASIRNNPLALIRIPNNVPSQKWIVTQTSTIV